MYFQNVRITPAYAGSTKILCMVLATIQDHPRLRGEYNQMIPILHAVLGSPLLTRGVLYAVFFQGGLRGIAPACAGSTHLRHISLLRFWDHPRLRGEYRTILRLIKRHVGSPPLARGILQSDIISLLEYGITPACAGSTFRCSGGLGFCEDHPRLRGEYRPQTAQ